MATGRQNQPPNPHGAVKQRLDWKAAEIARYTALDEEWQRASAQRQFDLDTEFSQASWRYAAQREARKRQDQKWEAEETARHIAFDEEWQKASEQENMNALEDFGRASWRHAAHHEVRRRWDKERKAKACFTRQRIAERVKSSGSM